MFSFNSLVQIVFANHQDIYYCDDLMKLTLDSYLWSELHDKYNVVYFVDIIDGEIIAASNGDIGAEQYKNKKGIFESREQHFAKWMRRRLRDKNIRCAFVCKMEVFERIMKNETDILQDIKWLDDSGEISGTIVLTLTPNIERSRDILFGSTVPELLGEDSISLIRRENNVGNMFELLKSSMQESCVFLNRYTRERVEAILTHIVFEHPERFTDRRSFEYCIDYLTQYMNNVYMQMTESRLFRKDFSLVNPFYRDVSGQLSEKAVWDDLVKRSVKNGGRLREYLGTDYVSEYSSGVSVFHDNDAPAHRCMKLCVPDAMSNHCDMEMIRTLTRIYAVCSSPDNKKENKEITGHIVSFLNKYDNAKIKNDTQTCRRLLNTILFCLQWMYVDSGHIEEVRRLVEMSYNYEKCSADYFALCSTSGYHASQKGTKGSLITENFGKKLKKYEIMLEGFDDLITTKILNLSVMDTTESFRRVLDTMQDVMDDFRKPEDELIPAKSTQGGRSRQLNSGLMDELFDPSAPTTRK